jgi:hypothetical protein
VYFEALRTERRKARKARLDVEQRGNSTNNGMGGYVVSGVPVVAVVVVSSGQRWALLP